MPFQLATPFSTTPSTLPLSVATTGPPAAPAKGAASADATANTAALRVMKWGISGLR
jgi:hypothetical protein